MIRAKTKEVKIGNITIGGNSPIVIQSMLSLPSTDIPGNIAQAKALEAAGCKIIRVAVPDSGAFALVSELKKNTRMPVVADIHFDYRLAIGAVDAGADKIRINPGNIGGRENVAKVAERCKAAGVPIRIGVNSGSVEKDLLERFGGPTPQALAESISRHVKLLEAEEFYDIVLAVKSSDVVSMVEATKLISERYDYPLHIGVTEAGTPKNGIIKSAVGIGSLLTCGIGDTVRVSLTGDPVPEIDAAYRIIKASGRSPGGVNVVSCPTCGRTRIDLARLADKVEKALEHTDRDITVAVMGCAVNGPGEAREADIGIAGGNGEALLFKKGVPIKKIPESEILDVLLEEINNM